ncbi:MAG TPA: CoA transferase [Tepidiformaceae bacterium]|nr:CoA transferase [Tepidiformaceae bacterium]
MLEGIRILELSGDPAGAFATRLLALYGAEVISIEPPTGSPVRWWGSRAGDGPEAGLLFAYLGGGKKSITLDPADQSDHARLVELASGAHAIIESGDASVRESYRLGLDDLRQRRPGLVVCSVTPFGLTGPHARWRATSLVSAASGGQLWMCGDPDAEPLKTAGEQAYMQGGLHAFGATVGALFAAFRTGAGDHIDISLQEAQASALEGAGPAALVRGFDSPRTGNAMRAIWAIYPCADGYVGVHSMARQSHSIFECIGHPEMAGDPQYAGFGVTPEANEVVRAVIEDWTSSRTIREIYDESAKFRAPFSMIPEPRELLRWPSLEASHFWQTIDHPVLGAYPVPSGPIIFDGDRGAASRPPLLGEHNGQAWATAAPIPTPTSSGPRPMFDGVRVLDLTQVWAGPFATRILGDMGADVIKVEGPSFPDAIRVSLGGPAEDRSFNKVPYFNEYNRNKRGLTLDLQQPEGKAAFLRLVATADVVIENWSVGVADRLGLAHDDLRKLKPDIITVSMPGFGLEGPEAQRIAYGPAIEQMGGLVSLQGYEGGPPHKSGISYGDPVAGVTAAGGIAMALLRRQRTGEGCRVVVPQRDGILGLVGEFFVAEALGRLLPRRQGNRDAVLAPHGVYRGRDDSGRWQADATGTPIAEITDTWLALAVDSDEAWLALRDILGDPWLLDPAMESAEGRRVASADIDAVIAAWARDRDPAEAADLLQSRGIAASPVLSPLMLVSDPHVTARGFVTEYDHPEAGRQRANAPVWHLRERPFAGLRPAPCLGEHNAEILTSLAGYTAGEVREMTERGILSDAPLAG